ncbi:hypothetical protein VV11_009325 [Trichodesmium erythraeum 21-75]|nr:hypothetical protein [Trichodesmium erythraeum 21-75]
MCGFILANFIIENVEQVNEKIKYRGPDYTNSITTNYGNRNYHFIHNLLNITGKFSPQPFVDEDIFCMFNGQIYNYANFGKFESDGQCLLPAYKE